MGFTGLARWVNAPTTGLELIRDNIIYNHNGKPIGPWKLSVKSYRSSLGAIPGLQILAERTMCALTMNENVFVLLEDPAAPTKADVIATLPPEGDAAVHMQGPAHYRTTFLTLRPPDALDQLLTQLRARWAPIRQTTSLTSQRSNASGQQGHQLVIEGYIFTIGNEWIVRVGNVTLAGGAVKGMLLEAEYLPLPVLHSQTVDGTSELLSNLLTSLLPNIRDAKTVAVTISDSQWEEVLWDREEEERAQAAGPETEEEEPGDIFDDIYVTGCHEATSKRGDWVGLERDRRSSFLIVGALRSEGIL